MKILDLTIVILAALSGTAFATNDEDSRDRFHAALKDCAGQLGLPAPEKGKKPPKLSEEQREALHTCLEKQGVPPPPPHHGHEAMRHCVEASGVKVPRPEPGGERPELTDAQKAVLDACHAKVEADK